MIIQKIGRHKKGNSEGSREWCGREDSSKCHKGRKAVFKQGNQLSMYAKGYAGKSTVLKVRVNMSDTNEEKTLISVFLPGQSLFFPSIFYFVICANR